MSWSPCLRCGAAKSAALVACPGCDELPVGRADRARHLVAGELPDAAREAVAAAVAAGEVPPLPDEEVAAMEHALEQASGPRVAAFALLVLGGPLLAIVASLLLLAVGLLSL